MCVCHCSRVARLIGFASSLPAHCQIIASSLSAPSSLPGRRQLIASSLKAPSSFPDRCQLIALIASSLPAHGQLIECTLLHFGPDSTSKLVVLGQWGLQQLPHTNGTLLNEWGLFCSTQVLPSGSCTRLQASDAARAEPKQSSAGKSVWSHAR